MANLTTKYSVGDVVWYAGTTVVQRKHPCPDCKDTREWTALAPSGAEYTFACPRCSASYHSDPELKLVYSAHTPTAERRTIGSVRVNTEDRDCPVTYMCHETGVGSGNVYRETNLFPTKEDALAAAEILAAKANSEVKWIVKQYDQSLKVSDYQLHNAALEEARREKSKARSFLWNIGNLFDTISEAANKEEILEAIADYKQLDWERDKSKAGIAEQVSA